MDAEMFDQSQSRRDFLKVGVASASLSLCAGCALFITKRDPDLEVQQIAGEFRFEPDLFPALAGAGGTLAIQVKGMEDKVLVFRRPDGTLAALDMACTHWGCDVSYDLSQDLVVCPCHGAQYDVVGHNLKGPATRPLRAYPIRMADEKTAIVVVG